MKKEYIITRQGKDVVLYEGLLDEAHKQGLKRISTTLIQIPHEDNSHTAIVAAEVETERGVFGGIGDASPSSLSRERVPESIRVAEDRAKSRALRDAVNAGMLPAEELASSSDQPQSTPELSGVAARATREAADGYRSEVPKASPFKPASANQLATIAKLSRLLGEPEEPNSEMTSAEASERITELSREYNERKGAARRSA